MGEPEKTPLTKDEAANEAQATNGQPSGQGQGQGQGQFPPGAAPGGAGDTAGQAPGARAALGSASVAEVEKELDAALAKAAENYDLFVRAKAETENVRRRAQDDVAKAHKYAVESFAEALVPVMDSLERALETQNASPETVRAGVEITLKQLASAFEKGRLLPIDPKGEKFDPHRHQAISMVAGEGVAPNHVVAVLQKGWMINDRVLRPALVTVAQG